MNNIASTIKSILEQRRGADNAITGEELQRRLKPCGINICRRRMRTIIETECPDVCFNFKGYFLPLAGPDGKLTPEGQAEVDKVVKTLRAYHQGLADREKAILKAYPADGQMSLDLEVRT
jgi:hypothetical protein